MQAETPYYHLQRKLVPVDCYIAGTPTISNLYAESADLTDTIVGTIELKTNDTYAFEKHAALSVSYGSAEGAWEALLNYSAPSNKHPVGIIFDNVGWARGTKFVNGGWGAYLWVIQNQIAFQSSTSRWWTTTNGLEIEITNVMVGSLGDYDPTNNVVDIGPYIPTNFLGAHASESKKYQVDITNVGYQLSIPYIWITPRYALRCVGGSNVQYTVTGTNIPQGVTWLLIPAGLSGGAVLQTSATWSNAHVTPGTVATSYQVRATSKDNTNSYDEVELDVLKVDIEQKATNVCWSATNVTLNLTTNSFLGYGTADWSSEPSGISGSGTNLAFNPHSLMPTTYVVRAQSSLLTNCFDTCTVTILKVEIAMDGDHNGTVDFEDPDDQKYIFWVNDDHDEKYVLQTELISVEDDLGGTPDWDNDHIGFNSSWFRNSCRRDLEDFTRLHIRVDDKVANLPGITYFLKFENTNSSSPSVNIFEAVNKELTYLTDGIIAGQQIEKPRLIKVGTSEEVQLPNQYIKTNQVSPFILEGCREGKGELTLIVKTNGNEICRTAVMLELRPITRFYQTFRVDTVGQDSQEVPQGYNSDFTSSDDYLLFVHGFNVNAIDKAYWPGTVFKRLWWQGYKGHVGFFDWPCVLFSLFNPWCYDQSESNAWYSGAALLDRINRLNSGSHSGKVRLLAHSQGSVVAGEALRLASGKVVHTYIGTQAAVPADCYQTGVQEYFSDYSTPNVFVNYPPTSNTYLTGVSGKTEIDQLFSYYNTKDYALHSAWVGSWEWNNAARPDVSYWYEGPRDIYDTSAQPTPSRFYYDDVPYVPPAPRDMVFPDYTFEIFSFAAEARGSGLGVQATMNDFATFNLEDPPLNYNKEHYSHSRQFRSNIVDEKAYWSQVKSDCKFEQ